MKKILLFLAFLCYIYTVVNAQDNKDFNSATNFFNKANQFKQKYQLDSAAVNYKKAADLFMKHGYMGNYILSQYSQGDIYVLQNKINRAAIIFENLEILAKETQGEKNKFLVNIYYGLGIVAYYKGKNNEALKLFKQSLKLSEEYKSNNTLFTANLYASLGNTYATNGKFQLALDHYLKDLNLRKKIVGENHPMLSVAYNNICITYRNVAEYDKALAYIDKALNLSIKAFGEKNRDIGNYYNNKGGIYFDKGQYDMAKEFIQKALNINLAVYGEMHKTVADNYNYMGLIHKEQNDEEKALTAFKDAYEIQKVVLGETHPDIAITCNNIGQILKQQKKYSSALVFYNEAIKVIKNSFGSNHPELSAYYNNIGTSYSGNNEKDKALANFIRAVNILESNYGNKFPGLVKMYTNIADIYTNKKQYNDALKYYQKGLIANLRDFNPDSTDYITNPALKNYYDIKKILISLKGKAKVLDGLFVKDSLFQYADQSYKTYILLDSVITLARKSAVKKSDKIVLGNETKIIYEDAVISAMGMSYLDKKEKSKEKYYEKAFYFSEKNKAGVLSEAVAASEAKKFAGIPDDILNKEKEYQKQISDLEKKIAETSDDNELTMFRENLFEFNEKSRQLSSEIEKNYPEYYESKYKSTKIEISRIQKTLNSSTAVRSYFSGNDVIIIFTITKNDIKVNSIDKPEDFFDKVKQFKKLVTSGQKSNFPKYAKLAHEFYNLFFPVDLPEEIENLIIIPDGMISVIPFDALFTENYGDDILTFKNYPFLIKKFKTSYFYSADLFHKSVKKSKSSNENKKWIGIAPVFNDLKNNTIKGIEASALPASKDEVNKIFELFADEYLEPVSIIEKEANESYIKSEKLNKYNYLHIATHGIVDTEHPELSGILLYPDNSKNDAILYSGEIYNLELNADLVVLSACETGLGKISKSEGIIGLSRSLLYAGANNVIVSLWKVADESTSKLMIDFYINLLKNKQSYTEALHNAKLKLINEGSTFAHPFFWSPFILIGK